MTAVSWLGEAAGSDHAGRHARSHQAHSGGADMKPVKPRQPPSHGTGLGIRMRSLLHSTFELEFNAERFSGRNPCDWSEKSKLSQLLGPKPVSVPHAAPDLDDLPHIIAHILDPNRSRIPGHLTTAELTDCTGVSDIALRKYRDADLLHPVKPIGRMWSTAARMYPIEEARRVLQDRWKHEPRPREREESVILGDIVLFTLLTGVRPAMASRLRWRNIQEKERFSYIEYLAARGDIPAEHKTGYDGTSIYLVMLHRQSARHHRTAPGSGSSAMSLAIKPDGFVFVHSRTHDGLDKWFGRPVNNNASNLALKRIALSLDAVKKKDITLSGVRHTIGAWAVEAGYSSNAVNLTLGHIIDEIRQNPTNKHYLYDIKKREERHAMMAAWEGEMLKLHAPPPRTSEVVPLRRRSK